MNKVLVLALLLGLLSCSNVRKPEFQRMENIKITDVTIDSITVIGDAIFFNPNPLGVNILSSEMDVQVNELMLSNIKQNYSLKVGGNENFDLPVKIVFPPKAVFGKDSGLLSSVLQVLGNKKIDLHYKGEVKIDIAGLEVDVPFEFDEELAFKF